MHTKKEKEKKKNKISNWVSGEINKIKKLLTSCRSGPNSDKWNKAVFCEDRINLKIFMAEQDIIFRMAAIAHSNHMENYKKIVIKNKQTNWVKLKVDKNYNYNL